MNDIYYSIHDFIRIKWQNPLWSIVPDFASKYHYFEVDKAKYESLNDNSLPTISIKSGPPPQPFRKSIVPAAERFGVGKDIVQIQHQHGRMQWTSWLSGIETNSIHIWYEFPFFRRLQWPWIMFPDHIICFHVIQPIIEYLLGKNDIAFIHAGAVAKNNQATLIAGRGGVGKTTYLIHLIKKGWEFLSDDLVLIHDGKVYPFPTGDTFFDYFVLTQEDDKIGLKNMLGALLHVRKRKPLSFSVAKPSEPVAVNLLVAWKGERNEIRSEKPADDDLISKILASDRLERLTYVDVEETMGRFMFHLNQVNGTNDWNLFWDHHKNLLTRNLLNVPSREVFATRKVELNGLLGTQ